MAADETEAGVRAQLAYAVRRHSGPFLASFPSWAWFDQVIVVLPPQPGIAELKLGFEWADPARALRLRQIFEQDRRFTFPDLIAAQTDVTTVTGERGSAPQIRVVRTSRCASPLA